MDDRNTVWFGVIRLAGFVGAICLWYLSLLFSVDGFQISVDNRRWVGYVLAGVITVLELIFNKGVYGNPTLFFFGMIAYVYGIGTNLVGVLNSRSVALTSELLNHNPIEFLLQGAVVVAIAFMLEVVPEALIMWTLYPEKSAKGTVGDFISSVVRGTSVDKNRRFPSQNVQNGRLQQGQPSNQMRQVGPQRDEYHGQDQRPFQPNDSRPVSHYDSRQVHGHSQDPRRHNKKGPGRHG